MQVASIVGERFSAGELGALAPGLDVGAALASLRRAGLILEDREDRGPDRYRFKHLLMRDVAYAGLPKAVRADLHEQFAAELERAVGDRRDEFAEVLAHHAERAFSFSAEVRAHRDLLAPRAKRALGWALALGDRARRREDAGLLAVNVGVAVGAVATLRDDVTPEDQAHVALLVAEDRRLSGQYVPAQAAFDRALGLAGVAGRIDLAAWSHLGLARVMVLSSEFDEVGFAEFDRHTTEAARLFNEAGQPGAALEAGLTALERYWGSGQLGEMLERGRALRERARQLGDGPRELLICARLIWAAGQLGRPELASEYEHAAEELAARLGSRMPQWGRVAHCARLRLSGDFTAADACLKALYAEGVAERDPVIQIGSLRNLGEVLLEAGRLAEVLDALTRIVGFGGISRGGGARSVCHHAACSFVQASRRSVRTSRAMLPP